MGQRKRVSGGRRATPAQRLAAEREKREQAEQQRDDALHQADLLAMQQSATFNDALELARRAHQDREDARAVVAAAAARLRHGGQTAPDLRVPSLLVAIGGWPEHQLPPTPRSTLYAWLRAEKTARILGTDHRAKPKAQRPLVAGLLQLQASRSRRSVPRPAKDSEA